MLLLPENHHILRFLQYERNPVIDVDGERCKQELLHACMAMYIIPVYCLLYVSLKALSDFEILRCKLYKTK